MMGGIFISYRRDDSAGYAGRLYDRLAARFGSNQVFMDVEGIEPGTDFVVAIEKAVGACAVLIVLIGDEWLSTADAAGKRRLDDPNDFIRLETATALTRQIRVVPVLLDGTPMPPTDSLPQDLRLLTRRQAVEISHKQWESSTGELIRTLERILELPAIAPQTAAPPVDSARRSPVGRALTGLVVAGAIAALTWFLATPPAAMPDPAVPPVVATAGTSSTLPPTATQSAGQPRLVALAPRVDFGSAVVGSSLAGAVRFGNEGTAPASLVVPRLEGEDAGSFRIVVSTCAGDLAPGQTCEIDLGYQPLSAARRRATLLLALADGSQRASVELVGEASAAPAAERARTPVAPAALKRKSLAESPEPAAAKVTPAPAARSTAPPAAKSTASLANAVAAPGSAPAKPLAADKRWPVLGEEWHYRSRGKWPTSPKRSFSITVRSLAKGVVQEQFEPLSGSGATENRGSGTTPGFVNWNEIGTEFSPYLGAFETLAEGRSWRDFPTPDQGAYWTQWYSEAKVLGPETVTVPAGSYAAVKVEVWSSRRATGSRAEAQLEPVRIHFLLWYVPELKRYARMERRVVSASGSEMENDVFELVSHRGG